MIVHRMTCCWLVAFCLSFAPVTAQAACRQALALGLDVSGSVDAGEYALQMNGLANAFVAKEVQRAFLAVPGASVRLYVFVWAGKGGPLTILPWTEIVDKTDLIASANKLNNQYQRRLSSGTALGEALIFGRNALTTQNECWRLTLDISGDGKSNSGVHPQDLLLSNSFADITINALAVGQDYTYLLDAKGEVNTDLVDYFTTNVIRGTDAFVEFATGFQDYEETMIRKLLKELQTLPLGSFGVTHQNMFRVSDNSTHGSKP